MYQYKGLDDTIAAISTASGHGGIGIVRLSGDHALSVAENVFRSKNHAKVADIPSHSVRYGWVVDGSGQVIDEVLLTVMHAPKTYTTEHVVEINCHGGPVSMKAILSTVIDAGARLAEPGEFTKRAFIKGRIDLTQAEAVLDIINSRTNAFLKVSTHQLKGELSQMLSKVREQLSAVYVEMEAVINFPEDDIDSEGRKKLAADMLRGKQTIVQLLKNSEQGRIMREGMRLVLCGKPNVGKSSLLNVLLQVERAIVSDIAGTTRDTIEEHAQINGVPFQVIDTAGILDPRDLIEKEAVKRSQMHMRGADLVLVLVDGSGPLSDEDLNILNTVKDQNLLVVVNKVDLPLQCGLSNLNERFDDETIVKISALNKEGIDALKEKIVFKVLHAKTIDTDGALINNLRHIQSLKEAENYLNQSMANVVEGISLEFVSEDIKAAINCLDAITGRNVDADLLDTIFSQFCIGK